MQQQRLAAAGGIPESQFVQFIRSKRLEPVVCRLSVVIGLHFPIQAIQQLLSLVEIPIQINLGEQQRKILEILHVEHRAFNLVALFGDGVPMLHNIQVITAQIQLIDQIRLKQVVLQSMKKPLCPSSSIPSCRSSPAGFSVPASCRH